ncbi:hypothetical protein G6R40_06795 [Chryseobacterium sp. POL2]|uniref:hypothetical protein n=1 Tax=Chryseobacterium sp. POL2 TaxID=2713414 RepID=UPI0013E1E016|nr:hypothetical protein [Chryseobacterium sp. POL2]QIG89404.1 hypothetical protein G6R40_06795 [Chryseobacterium sp. POL2]
MIDNTKFLTDNQTIIERLQTHPDFVVCRPKTNNYYSLRHKDFGIKLSLDFRKAVENGKVVGFCHLEINVSPHYHFNQYRHNGNDFTPLQAISTISDILTYLDVKQREYNELNVCNIEFGLNIIPDADTKDLINGLYFYKKTPFTIPDTKKPYFKKTDATNYKQIKAYAKGLQFLDVPPYGINPNTFRFEVKSKQAKNICKYGINTATDLLNLETYNRLGQSLLNEWDFILCSNKEPDLSNANTDEVYFIEQGANVEFWSKLITEKHRNTFQLNREKYYKILGRKNNLHQQIKTKIVDKIFIYSKCANSTQRTPINREKLQNGKTTSTLINLEYAHFTKCLVTGLNISMQKKGSKFLCFSGLKYYKENAPEIYKSLKKKFLSEKMKTEKTERQFYYMAHNIRNSKTNPIHNRKSFEKRNYNTQQLQINF